MSDNPFVKKHRKKMASCCDACQKPLLWVDGRMICAHTTCRLYGKQQIIKRKP